MDTSSRFAVLCPEVDLSSAHRIKASRAKQDKVKKDPKPAVIPKVQEKNQLKKKQDAVINNIKKKKNDDMDLQALAFGFGRGKGNKRAVKTAQTGKENKPIKKENKSTKSSSERNKAKCVNSNHAGEEEDDWRKRDEEFVKSQNEKSLREAIIQSKLDFEEKTTLDKVTKTEPLQEKANSSKVPKNKKKKDKPITISLDQFHSLQPKEIANLRDLNLDQPTSKEEGIHPQKFSKEKFFNDVEEATRKTLEREHRQEQYKANASKINHEIQVKRFISEIEKRDFEIQALRLEVDSLRNQMAEVKSRNKKLCEVMSLSEMRSKGELVVELDKVTKGRDEFSEEIARLNAELEQERTKVSQLTTQLKKIQGKKRNADSSSK